MNLGQIRLYDLFRRELHLTDDKAAAFVLAVGEVVGMDFDTKKDTLATKGDLLAVKEDLKADVRAVKNDLLAVRDALKDDIHRLDIKIEQYKSETSKAIYWVGIVQFVAMVSSILAIIKFIK